MKKDALLIHGILLVALILRLINLNQSLWLDEAASAIISKGTIRSILIENTGDFMPPAFYLLLHWWMSVSTSEVWMRLLPVAFGAGSVWVLYFLTKQLFSKGTAMISSFLLAISPFHIYYSQELRPYSQTVFFGLLSTSFLLLDHYILYTTVSILLIYSLYTAPFLLFAHGVYIVVYQRSKLKKWLLSMGFIILSFVPYLPIFLQQLAGGNMLIQGLPGWSEAASVSLPKALPLILAKFMLGRITIDNKVLYTTIVILLFILASILIGKSLMKLKKSAQIFLFLIIPIILAFLFSIKIPVIAPQRLIYTLPFFLILIVSGIEILPKKLNGIFIVLVIVPSLFGLVQYYFNTRFQREQWRQATQFVEAHNDGQTQALFAFPEPFAPFLWYRRDPKFGIGLTRKLMVTHDDILRNEHVFTINNKLFFFHYLSDLTDREKKIPTRLDQGGFTKTTTTDFPGVGFVEEYNRR